MIAACGIAGSISSPLSLRGFLLHMGALPVIEVDAQIGSKERDMLVWWPNSPRFTAELQALL